MCLAQGQQHSDTGEAQLAAPRSQVKHSTTEPLRSLTKSDSEVMFCLQSYQGLIIDRLHVY